MKNTALRKNAVYSLNYFLTVPQCDLPVNHRQISFSDYLSGNEREFYNQLNEFMINEGFTIGDSPDYQDFSIEYVLNKGKQSSILMRCHSDFGKLQIIVKLNYFANYVQYVESLPEKIKQTFRTKSTCKFCKETCRQRRERVFEGETYTECGYLWNITFASYEPEDLEYYKEIILYESHSRKY
jgi:hypothetical protein